MWVSKNVNNRTVKLTQGDLCSTSKTNVNKAKSTQSVRDDSIIMADDAESDVATMC